MRVVVLATFAFENMATMALAVTYFNTVTTYLKQPNQLHGHQLYSFHTYGLSEAGMHYHHMEQINSMRKTQKKLHRCQLGVAVGASLASCGCKVLIGDLAMFLGAIIFIFNLDCPIIGYILCKEAVPLLKLHRRPLETENFNFLRTLLNYMRSPWTKKLQNSYLTEMFTSFLIVFKFINLQLKVFINYTGG